MNPKSKTRKSLKAARLKVELTQKDLAKQIGVHVNYYARVERGEEDPSLEVLKKLTKILKIKSSDILQF